MKKDTKGRNLQKGERQLKTGRYEYRYIDTDKKQHSIYSWKLFETDAMPSHINRDELSLREKEAEINKYLSKGHSIFHANHTTCNELFNRLMSNTNLKNSSQLFINSLYRNHVQPKIGAIPIGKITYQDVSQLCRNLILKDGLSGQVAHSVLILIHQIFEQAYYDGLVDSDPTKHVKLPATAKNQEDALTIEEQNELLDFLSKEQDRRMYEVTTVLVFTGMRVGEMLALTWKDIDFRNKTISINKTLHYERDLNIDKVHYYLTIPKTKAGVRKVPMMPAVIDILKEIYTRQTIEGFSDYEIDGEQGFIFCSRSGTPFANQYLNQEYISIVKRHNADNPAILLPRLHCHLFRHTFITRMIESGAPVKTVAAIVGHSDIKTTLSIYTTVTQRQMWSSIDGLQNYLSQNA